MFCMYCGKELPEDSIFCSGCGVKIQKLDPPQTDIIREEPIVKPPKRNLKIPIALAISIAALVVVLIFTGGSEDKEIPEEYVVEIVNGNYIESSYGAGTYHSGTVTVWVTMKSGHVFDGWYDSSGNCLSSDQTYRFSAKTITLYPRGGDSVSITIVKGLGIDSATGEGKYISGSTQSFKAEVLTGYEFKGWYSVDTRELLSDKPDCKINIGSGGTIAAVSDSDRYDGAESLRITPKNTYESCIWIVTDHWTHNYVCSSNDPSKLDVTIAPGRYDINLSGISSGTTKTETFSKTVNGTIDNYYHYDYKGKSYSAHWNLDYSLIENSYSKSVNRHPGYNQMANFVDYKSNTIVLLAKVLKEQSEGMSKNDQANFVLSFVQQVTAYETDERYNGTSEYWKYPMETLFDRRGDCEDTSALYCAIMKAMGYDMVLIIYLDDEYEGRGHAAAGVALDNVPGGTYYEKYGNKYYFCETTSDYARVGDITEGYDEGRLIRIT